MKKIILFLLISTAAIATINAQDNTGNQQRPKQEKRANIEALKVAFITRELNLTAEEAQKFWPVHNGYIEELKKIRKENMDNEIGFEEKALTIRKKAYADFKKVLGSDERANKVFKSEKSFNNMMRKELMNRKIKNKPADQQP